MLIYSYDDTHTDDDPDVIELTQDNLDEVFQQEVFIIKIPPIHVSFDRFTLYCHHTDSTLNTLGKPHDNIAFIKFRCQKLFDFIKKYSLQLHHPKEKGEMIYMIFRRRTGKPTVHDDDDGNGFIMGEDPSFYYDCYLSDEIPSVWKALFIMLCATAALAYYSLSQK